MKMNPFKMSAVAVLLAALLASGCQRWKALYQEPSMPALGSQSDAVWRNQEANAEVSDFVVHQHEFQPEVARLNSDGEDHVKQIAARLMQGQDVFVVVERSRTSARQNTEYRYPVHTNPELDMRRRDVIVRALAAMGIADSDERVVVAPAYAPGFTAMEAEAALRQGLSGNTSGVSGDSFPAGGGRF